MFNEKKINGFLISTDPAKLQINVIHEYLSGKSYWAQNIPLKTPETAIQGSVCFGVYFHSEQIGFARVITDRATFGYLADVYIAENFRQKGLSKELMKFIMEYPAFGNFRRFMLATKDAHALYEKFGFTHLACPERFMELKPFEKYPV